MIDWNLTTISSPKEGTPILFRVRGEKTIRVGSYASEFFRTKRVSHWAHFNLPEKG
jgi:hypothetical protein